MEPLLSIGQFARASGLSPRALRLYETKGILRPVRVDSRNGYRFYSSAQLGEAEVVRLARVMNMPLTEIRGLLDDDPEEAHRRLDRYWAELQAEVRTTRRALGLLHAAMSQEEEKPMDAFERGNELYFRERKIEEALKSYLAVDKTDPSYPTALRYVGHNIYGREWSRWEEGLPFIEEALTIAPDDRKLLEDAGRAYLAVGRIEEGKALLERAGTPVAARALERIAGTA